jgi:drug/metabolite transporter (DMT)-like permease
MGIGELGGLAAAALWACSSLFYGRTKLTAWQINFGKNVIASALLCLNLLLVTRWAGGSMFAADLATLKLLSISSVIGILIGDTFFFRSLQILGPRRALIVSTISPLFAAAIGWIILEERLSASRLLGVLMTLAGVIVVIAERGGEKEAPGHFPASSRWGIAMGLLGAVCNAIGATFSRLGTKGSEHWNAAGCDALEATVIRVCVAAIGCLVIALISRSLISTAQQSFSRPALRSYLPAVVCGPWLGIWMSQLAYKNCPLAVAITLTCTSPLFVLPILRIVYGHKITLRGVGGTVIALVGVYLTVAA